MRSLMKIGFALLALAFLLIGLAYGALKTQGVPGTSNPEGRIVTSEARTVGKGISAVELNGPIDMTLRQGAIPSLVVRGEKRLLGNVETVQDGGTLHIGTTGLLFRHRQPLQVELVLPTVDTLTIHGSGESTVNGFSGDHLQVNLTGSGNVVFNGRYKDINAGVYGSGEMELNPGNAEKVAVELSGSGQMTVVGSCKQLKASQTGSGDLNAQHLAAEQAAVELHGSGTSNISAKKVADLTLRGSGDINVYGNPDERNVNRTGSGEVSFKY